MKNEVAILGLGCFWGAQKAFKDVKGVIGTKVGFSGGKKKNPTYEEVYTDGTGHAEVVRVEFDPDQVTYKEVIKNFFASHDSTELNKQGGDVGTRYRTIIFYTTEEQKKIAEQVLLEENQKRGGKVVTRIEPFEAFYSAEEYHQDYLDKNGESCSVGH